MIKKFIIDPVTRLIVQRFSQRGKKALAKHQFDIGIFSYHRIGDAVFTIPTVKKLVHNYFNKSLVLFCKEETAPIYKYYFPDLKLVLLNNEMLYARRIAGDGIKQLINENDAETIFDITGTIVSASSLRFSSADKIFGVCEPYLTPFYTHAVVHRVAPTLQDIYADILPLVGINSGINQEVYYQYRFNITGDIVVQPYAGWEAKEWGIEKFGKLVSSLSQTNKVKVLLPNNRKKDASLFDKFAEVVVTESLEQLITELSKARVYVGCDSGPLYLAAMQGIPTLGIYGPSNPNYSVPIGVLHRYIQKEVSCRATERQKICSKNGGRTCSTIHCMSTLTVGEVEREMRQLISDIKRFEKINAEVPSRN